MPQIEINYIDNIVDFSQFKEQEKKKKNCVKKLRGQFKSLCYVLTARSINWFNLKNELVRNFNRPFWCNYWKRNNRRYYKEIGRGHSLKNFIINLSFCVPKIKKKRDKKGKKTM